MSAHVARDRELDGEGMAWGAAGLAASLLAGALIEPFRNRLGLENVVIVFLAIVTLCAAVGGRAAGMVAALSAALSYNFFFTTPYRTLRIDSAEQVLTVCLLFAAGMVAAFTGRRTRRTAAVRRQENTVIHLLEHVAKVAAQAGVKPGSVRKVDRAAAEGVRELLDARLVQVHRGDEVTAEAGETGLHPVAGELVRLDPDGRLPRGNLRIFSEGIALPAAGVALPLCRNGAELGALVIVPGPDEGVDRTIRVGLAGLAHVLAGVAVPVRDG
jgi:hypothetical protein